MSTTCLFAQSPNPEDDPVIKAAEILIKSLPNENRVKASADILFARLQLGLARDAAKDGRVTYQSAIEMAKNEEDPYKRPQAFAHLARSIAPENINSFDEILKEDSRYSVMEQIMERCREMGKYDLAYPLYEKIINMQTDPKIKANMRHYINRVYPMQISDYFTFLGGSFLCRVVMLR